MLSLACEAPGCTAAAAFRQMEPVDGESPRYLCIRHWNEYRILSPDQAALYGSLKLLGPLPENDGGQLTSDG
jgi:hypothetical protein